jgi:hypothetical protein
MTRRVNNVAWMRYLLSLGAVAAVGLTLWAASGETASPTLSPEARMGTLYTAPPADFALAPRIKEVPVDIPADAIWGSTGRDFSGHIWFGVSTREDGGSAHLLEYNPDTGEVKDRGDVVGELKQGGVYRAGEGQIKLHTKIVQAADGYLYFASFDEEGEDPARAIAPKWGGHFWRYRPGSRHWEHIKAVPQALVAVAGNGNWIYALGYWDHVLFQYDVQRRTWREMKVGSVPEHVSRNFVVDARGHAYVPRVREWKPGEPKASPNQQIYAELVEFDTDLREVASTPLLDYGVERSSHGLIGLAYLNGGSIVVSTHLGHLYRIVPPAGAGAAKVEGVGFVHPGGFSYAASLFPIDGTRYLAAVAQVRSGFDWIIYDLETRKSHAQKFNFSRASLLYGSSTRDDKGRFYVVGQQRVGGAGKPLVLQIDLRNTGEE